jgi:hypothetical protein
MWTLRMAAPLVMFGQCAVTVRRSRSTRERRRCAPCTPPPFCCFCRRIGPVCAYPTRHGRRARACSVSRLCRDVSRNNYTSIHVASASQLTKLYRPAARRSRTEPATLRVACRPVDDIQRGVASWDTMHRTWYATCHSGCLCCTSRRISSATFHGLCRMLCTPRLFVVGASKRLFARLLIRMACDVCVWCGIDLHAAWYRIREVLQCLSFFL